MANLLTTHVSSSTSTITPEDYLTRLNELAVRWRSHQGVGLEIRLEMGKLLNDQFGTPPKRQARGAHTLEEAAEKLGSSQSDLSRMRWFAHRFRSIKDLQDRHPDVTSWTSLKHLLPTLKPTTQKRKKQVPRGIQRLGKPTKSLVRRLRKAKRMLKDLSSSFSKSAIDLAPEEREEVLAQFKDLSKAVEDCLQVRVDVGQLLAEVTLSGDESAAGETPLVGKA
jgi:hypothetical protein